MPDKNKPTKQKKVKPVDYSSSIKKLVEKGKKGGKLDQRDIFSLIPDTPDNPQEWIEGVAPKQ